MHTILRTTVAGLALASLGIASSASAATATADADAVILAALTVTNTADMDFGSIANNGTGGAVTLSATDGSLSCPTLVCAASGTPASFHVVGAAGQPVSIQFTDSNIDLIGPGGVGVDEMPLSLSTIAGPFVLTGGVLDFNVGGVLTVGATETAGTYTGQMEVVVLYN